MATSRSRKKAGVAHSIRMAPVPISKLPATVTATVTMVVTEGRKPPRNSEGGPTMAENTATNLDENGGTVPPDPEPAASSSKKTKTSRVTTKRYSAEPKDMSQQSLENDLRISRALSPDLTGYTVGVQMIDIPPTDVKVVEKSVETTETTTTGAPQPPPQPAPAQPAQTPVVQTPAQETKATATVATPPTAPSPLPANGSTQPQPSQEEIAEQVRARNAEKLKLEREKAKAERCQRWLKRDAEQQVLLDEKKARQEEERIRQAETENERLRQQLHRDSNRNQGGSAWKWWVGICIAFVICCLFVIVWCKTDGFRDGWKFVGRSLTYNPFWFSTEHDAQAKSGTEPAPPATSNPASSDTGELNEILSEVKKKPSTKEVKQIVKEEVTSQVKPLSDRVDKLESGAEQFQKDLVDVRKGAMLEAAASAATQPVYTKELVAYKAASDGYAKIQFREPGSDYWQDFGYIKPHGKVWSKKRVLGVKNSLTLDGVAEGFPFVIRESEDQAPLGDVTYSKGDTTVKISHQTAAITGTSFHGGFEYEADDGTHSLDDCFEWRIVPESPNIKPSTTSAPAPPAVVQPPVVVVPPAANAGAGPSPAPAPAIVAEPHPLTGPMRHGLLLEIKNRRVSSHEYVVYLVRVEQSSNGREARLVGIGNSHEVITDSWPKDLVFQTIEFDPRHQIQRRYFDRNGRSIGTFGPGEVFYCVFDPTRVVFWDSKAQSWALTEGPITAR